MFPWLRTYLQTGSKPATHFYAPTKSYVSIPNENRADFWIKYCDEVSQGRNPALYEVVTGQKALQLALDIRLTFDRNLVPCHPDAAAQLIQDIENYIVEVISVIQAMISHCFERTEAGAEYIACYLRRNQNHILVWRDDAVEYVARLIFPYARVINGQVSKFVRMVRSQLQIGGHYPPDRIEPTPLTGLENFLLPVLNQVELYGSSPDDQTPSLELVEIYGVIQPDVKSTYELTRAFFPNHHSVVHQGELGIDEDYHYWLPLFFSSGFYDYPLKAREKCFNEDLPKITMSTVRENGEVLDRLERASRLLNCISPDRVRDHWSWLDLGQALHSIDEGDEGLRLWRWVTNEYYSSNDITNEELDSYWTNFDLSQGIDIGTLEYFSMIDDRARYDELHEPIVRAALDRALLNPDHTPVAAAFKACYPHDFICSNFRQGEWYQYLGHRWVHMDGVVGLMQYITDKFRVKLEEYQAKLATRISTTKDLDARNRDQQKITQIHTLITKLGSNTYKTALCNELRANYYCEHFTRLKDANPHYTATRTGVIDLRGGKAIVRPGKPQDYCTRTTRHGVPKLSWEHKDVQVVMQYLNQVFRSGPLLRCVIRLLSSVLLSGNPNKIFPIFSGEGNNSKSMLVRLIEAAMGEYAIKLPTSLITGKPADANTATPALIHAQGAKIAFLEEPTKHEVIQSGTVKHLTGRDSIYLRDLYQRGNKIIDTLVTALLVLVANRIPEIPDCQEAIWNRTRVYAFTSKWGKDAPTDPIEQMRQGLFPEDRFFDLKLNKMAPALLWIMVNSYEEYYQQGLNEPAEVLAATENFRISNNFYIHFIRDCVKSAIVAETGDIDLGMSVELREMFQSFKAWWHNQGRPGKVPNMLDFKENLEIIWKAKADENNRWYGMYLVPQLNQRESLLLAGH